MSDSDTSLFEQGVWKFPTEVSTGAKWFPFSILKDSASMATLGMDGRWLVDWALVDAWEYGAKGKEFIDAWVRFLQLARDTLPQCEVLNTRSDGAEVAHK